MKIQNNQSGFAHPVGIVVVAVTVLVVGFAGYRIYDAQHAKKQLNSNTQEVGTSEVLPSNLSDVLEVAKVKELATQSTSATVKDLELDNEDGVLVYKVTLSDGSLVVLNAKSGQKLKNNEVKVEDDGEAENALPANFTVAVSLGKAREIALTKFPDGTVSKIELDVEDGKVVISVRFADKARVDVDAATGTVVRVKNPDTSKSTQKSTGTSSSTPTSSGSSSSGSGSGGTTTKTQSSGSGSSGSSSGSSGSTSGSSGSSSDDDDHDDDGSHGGSGDDSSDDSNSGSGSSGSGSGR